MATQAATAPDPAAGNLIASLGQMMKPGGGGQMSQQDVVQLLLKNMPQLTEYAKQGKLNDTQLSQVFIHYPLFSLLLSTTLYFAISIVTMRVIRQDANPDKRLSVASHTYPTRATTTSGQHSRTTKCTVCCATKQCIIIRHPFPFQGDLIPAGPFLSCSCCSFVFQSTPPIAPPANAGSSALKRKSPGDDITISASTSQGYQISTTLNITNPGPQAWPNSSAPGRPTLTGGLPAGRMSGVPSAKYASVL